MILRLAAGTIALVFATGAFASAQDAAAIARGEKAYAANKCSMCHSIGTAGNKKGPLDGVGSKLSESEIREWLVHPAEMTKKTGATRKPPMRAYASLPKEDLDALVAFLASKKK